ncbi:MAG: hypothetical protein AVDCRST_MAG88-669, partial [uncultured Thermomicrobiales bacterium]
DRPCSGADALGAGSAASPRADVSGTDAARARTLARPLAASARLARQQSGGRAGARGPHHRELARGIRPRRPRRPGLRADGRPPPALDPDAQAGL